MLVKNKERLDPSIIIVFEFKLFKWRSFFKTKLDEIEVGQRNICS